MSQTPNAPTTVQMIAQAKVELSLITPTTEASGYITRVKVGTPYFNTKTGKMSKWTDKSKPCMGIPDSYGIIWAHVNFDTEDYQLAKAFAKSQGIEIAELFARVGITWFNLNREEIERCADGFVEVAMTIEKAISKRDAAKRAYEAALKAIDILSAKDAETNVDEDTDVDDEDAPPQDEEPATGFPTDEEIAAAAKPVKGKSGK